jgi:hypothetical protein
MLVSLYLRESRADKYNDSIESQARFLEKKLQMLRNQYDPYLQHEDEEDSLTGLGGIY